MREIIDKVIDKYNKEIESLINNKSNIPDIEYLFDCGYLTISYKDFNYQLNKYKLFPFIEYVDDELTKSGLVRTLESNQQLIDIELGGLNENIVMAAILRIIDINFKNRISKNLYMVPIRGVTDYYALVDNFRAVSINTKNSSIRVVVKPQDYIKTKGVFRFCELVAIRNHLLDTELSHENLSTIDYEDVVYIKRDNQKLCIIDKSTNNISFKTRIKIGTFIQVTAILEDLVL